MVMIVMICTVAESVPPDPSFTRFQVNHRKVCFKPPTAELGLVPRILQFFFDVEDTSGNVLPNQRFTVLLNPVDNQPPVITNGRIKINEDGVMILSPDVLAVEDPDTDGEELMFEVRRTVSLNKSRTYFGNPIRGT